MSQKSYGNKTLVEELNENNRILIQVFRSSDNICKQFGPRSGEKQYFTLTSQKGQQTEICNDVDVVVLGGKSRYLSYKMTKEKRCHRPGKIN